VADGRAAIAWLDVGASTGIRGVAVAQEPARQKTI
jgi:hypothetical protein